MRCATPEEAQAELMEQGVETRRSPFVDEALLVERGHTSDRRWRRHVVATVESHDARRRLGRSRAKRSSMRSGRGNKTLQIGARMADQGGLL
jgi:hypothetical protein